MQVTMLSATHDAQLLEVVEVTAEQAKDLIANGHARKPTPGEIEKATPAKVDEAKPKA